MASVAACSNPGGNNGVAANEAGNAAAANPAPAPAPPPAANTVAGNNMAAAAPAAAYTANGFEPGWALSIAGGQMVYQSQNGPNLTVPAPAPQTVNNGLKYVTSQLTVTIIHTPCQGVNEHNYADTVQVDVAGQTLNGCGE
ncbi:MAG TPA: hypothetical protein VMS43_07750 [Allosphingosinicella sp.]|nr:hypothetical protein [Allosphingosinicella sp.]